MCTLKREDESSSLISHVCQISPFLFHFPYRSILPCSIMTALQYYDGTKFLSGKEREAERRANQNKKKSEFGIWNSFFLLMPATRTTTNTATTWNVHHLQSTIYNLHTIFPLINSQSHKSPLHPTSNILHPVGIFPVFF